MFGFQVFSIQMVTVFIFLPFAKLLERRPDNSFWADHTVSSNPDVGQISSDNCLRLDNVLPVEDNVLRAAQNRKPTHAIPRRLFNNNLKFKHTKSSINNLIVTEKVLQLDR